MSDVRPRHPWVVPTPCEPTADARALAAERGISAKLLRVLARRGPVDAAELRALLDDPPLASLHDPTLLPDIGPFVERCRGAAARGERVMVFGDFDADGLTGLAILVLALRGLGIDAQPYVPSRADEGHGLSLAAVERARADGQRLIVTADCGTTSVDEVAAARAAGIDVLITDHHAIPARLPEAAALVNPHLPGSLYPNPDLSGAGVAFSVARALLADQPDGAAQALSLADLAAIGLVADVVPIHGENRAIVRLGLARMATDPRPGIAALMAAAGVDAADVDREAIAFAIAPRLNAVGRVGDGLPAARLLLATDGAEAEALGATLETANDTRRQMLAAALVEAREAADREADAPIIVICGEWPVGVIGLVAGRLADERGRPAVVVSTSVEPWRGSARSDGAFDLAAAFARLGDLFERSGGHPQAAGCQLPSERYPEFRRRLLELAPAVAPDAPRARTLRLDLVLRAESVDYVLLRELAPLDGGAEAPPLVGISGLTVARVRAASGGHTQITLRKGNEVLDGICFGRADLAETLHEGDRLDVVAELASRTFGGYESLQLEVRDVGPVGTLAAAMQDAPERLAAIALPVAVGITS